MAKFKIKIEGLEQMAEAVKVAPALVVKELSEATKRSIGLIQASAKTEAPFNKGYGGGTLRQRILARMLTKLKGYLIADVDYSAAVHEGTRPHIIRAVNKKVLANQRTGQIFGKIVRHPGTRPNPFFDRAIKNNIAKIQDLFSNAIIKVMKTL